VTCLPPDDLLALMKTVAAAGLKAKPELGIQFGGGRRHASCGTCMTSRTVAVVRIIEDLGLGAVMFEAGLI
jgi:phosphosulfolactate synthase (CoM biosynthesis protein A)